ncbi:SCO family protein [Hydrogenophaga pseudoflava]|uniref:SCO family protein n=1 Tax=Hydrogenophaga pseudoflava TaxID=47421 RepID=UPI000A045B76|nr:SCO family protein [Hydrogenophaga pseudoflava]
MSRRQSLLWLAAGAAGLLSGCDRLSPGGQPATPSFKGIDITGADYARGFSLTDFNGQTRTLADFQGRVVMLYFGFVQCPDVCPTALTRAAAVMERLGPRAGDLQVVFVTVDPERDTPELLREYMAAFHPSFLALTGNAEQIAQTAKDFRAFYKKVPTGSSYTMDHTALSYLFDRQGRIRVALRHEQTADDYTADVRALLDAPAS